MPEAVLVMPDDVVSAAFIGDCDRENHPLQDFPPAPTDPEDIGCDDDPPASFAITGHPEDDDALVDPSPAMVST